MHRILVKLRNFSQPRKKKLKIPLAITTLSNPAIEASFLDVEGKCFPMEQFPTLTPKVIADEKIAKCLSDAIRSFEYFPETKTIFITDKDLAALAIDRNGTATQVFNSLGLEGSEGVVSLSRFADDKTLVLKRSGVSGVLHKFVNGAFVSGSAVSTFTTTAASHVSGVTGLPLIVATPSIVIFTPMIGGLFFGSLERLTSGSRVGMVFGVARDVCLIPPRIAEITLNSVFPGPIFKVLGIDSPVNATGYLRFGAGYDAVPGHVKKGIFASIIGRLNKHFNP